MSEEGENKDALIEQLKSTLLAQEEEWQRKLEEQEERIQQNFLAVHTESVAELEQVHEQNMQQAAEAVNMWRSRAQAASDALHALEQ